METPNDLRVCTLCAILPSASYADWRRHSCARDIERARVFRAIKVWTTRFVLLVSHRSPSDGCSRPAWLFSPPFVYLLELRLMDALKLPSSPHPHSTPSLHPITNRIPDASPGTYTDTVQLKFANIYRLFGTHLNPRRWNLLLGCYISSGPRDVKSMSSK